MINSKIDIQGKGSGNNWSPVQGPTFTDLLTRNASLSDEEREQLSLETLQIIKDCIDPAGPAKVNTGLVIGYVQSGKTLSFTGLAALASDNQYKIVILLAGTNNNLVLQSNKRLREDLEIDSNRRWKTYTTQDNAFGSPQLEGVKGELKRWDRGNSRARTILIVCMKQHQHISKLAALMSELDLSDVPTLIVDDEGDQAGMNTRAQQGEESPTYSRIMALRDQFPMHSYVLYTATPQAPLLISRIDTLSPDFGLVLTPGENYAGGQDFFGPQGNRYQELILRSEVPDPDDPPSCPPESLLSALRDFFVGVAIGFHDGEDQAGKNRSMMIHPAVPKVDHRMYARWVTQTKIEWASILEDKTHPLRKGLLDAFRKSAQGLFKTHEPNLSFDGIEPWLLEALEMTEVQELNTSRQARIPTVDWEREYSWILVGGIGLDRGFTVEGLTVSYMPRSIGGGNADSIQQRARFFGYKRGYLGLCRIYLTPENIDAFTDYVDHEEAIRNSIGSHLRSGKSLKDWRRQYPLDQRLRPTRNSVILLEMYQSRGKGGWIAPDHPHDDVELVSDNRHIADQIISTLDFQRYAEPGWNEKQIIPAFDGRLPLAEFLPYFEQFRYKWPDDSLKHASLTLMLERLLDKDKHAVCSFYAFSGPWSGVNAKRSLTDTQPAKIKNLFQGKNAPTNYPGARALISDQHVTFQLHRYDIETSDKSRTMRDVPVIAVHIPDHLMERIWIEAE